jgi:hypothetical protein
MAAVSHTSTMVLVICAAAAAAAACGEPHGTEAGTLDAAAPDATAPDAAVASTAVPVSGHAFTFTAGGGDIVGATVRWVEQPEVTAPTGEGGAFEFPGVPFGRDLTLELLAEGFPPIRTGTHVVPVDGLEHLTFQAPDAAMYRLMSSILRITPDPARCQIASTVTRIGNSLYDDTPGTHGEPGATVRPDPMPTEVDGPVYFNLARYNAIWPDRALTETTADGGVLFLNVPPGDYTLTAHKSETTFRPVRIGCRAGYLVNASPPWGLQALTGGVGPRTEPDWQ